ncbi:hypothetical protein [Peribacillus muralis]|uniref:hypothetical protein n=1 Tax=Peribacillus muralis TaxID=264697 RepID=UPI003D060668
MEVGYHLSKSEVKELLTSFEEMKKFHNVIGEMKKYRGFDFDINNLEVVQALKFDATREQHVISAKTLVLKVNDKISLRYITRHFNGEFDSTNDFFVGTILNKGLAEATTTEQLVFRAADDFVVSTIQSEIEDEVFAAAAEENEKFNQEFNFDENYYPGQLLDQDVNAEGFFDGCIAGGYIYCGGKCGGHPACSGSKSGINKLDNCCKTHDCCYHNNGVKYPNCYCDQRLCDCSQASGYAGGRIIVEATMCFVC